MSTASDCQTELNLRLRRGPERLANDVRELEQLLRGRGWLKAAEIERQRPEWADPEHRYIRRLASRSLAVVSGPGTPGYILAEELTAEQLSALDHAGNSLIHQARDMARRGIRFRRIAATQRAATALTQPHP